MKNDSRSLTPEQSLELITAMIGEAKGKLQRNNFFFLFWGWIIATANLGMYTLAKLDYDRPYAVWLITIPAWAFTLYKVFSRRKVSTHHSHFDKISGWLWISFGVSIFILVVFGFKINYQLNPVILVMTAIPTFASGIMLKFKPLMIGGALFWLFGVAAFLSSQETQPLISTLAILCGYLIPGYMLRSKED